MSAFVKHVSDADFKDAVINSDKPVLVDFWAEWCGPCRAIAPVLDELAEEMADDIQVVKVNVDDNQAIASAMGIRSIPTLIVFKDGKAVANHSGAVGMAQLKNFIAQAI
ncbi:thioredoxin [Hahella sp. KA22]|uniref:thioredoxin n=1 Tax=Hahella sp. KA22 TaxID=1628392 RepID=UPI000FDEAA82|nr:thioredoxin [Hahella sp. KA22]AZZ94130.1 thioredoxin [Hahella sp. KA22]QAY57504.1 thioredoxin [Hahella sp. KA22]